MKILFPTLICTLFLGACGGSGGDVVYRMEQTSPNPHNVIGITNAGGHTQAYGSVGFSTDISK